MVQHMRITISKKESKQHANIAWCEETLEDKASQKNNTL
jgi:hypothetical protein